MSIFQKSPPFTVWVGFAAFAGFVLALPQKNTPPAPASAPAVAAPVERKISSTELMDYKCAIEQIEFAQGKYQLSSFCQNRMLPRRR